MDLLAVLSRIWMLMCLKWPYVTVVSYMYTDCIWHSVVLVPHRISGNLKLLRESTNADRKRLKIAFLIANCRFRLAICNLKRCCNAYRSTLLDSHDSSRLPPIRCGYELIHLVRVLAIVLYFHTIPRTIPPYHTRFYSMPKLQIYMNGRLD